MLTENEDSIQPPTELNEGTFSTISKEDDCISEGPLGFDIPYSLFLVSSQNAGMFGHNVRIFQMSDVLILSVKHICTWRRKTSSSA
jgi:hypothetical protein